METVRIEKSNVSTVTICGPEHLKGDMLSALIRAKTMVNNFNGVIIRNQDFPDGFFLEVVFPSEQLKYLWEVSIGVK